jgi:hypothetical protein
MFADLMKLNATTAEALLREGLVPLSDISKLVPPAASGKPMHRAVGWRWVRAGVLGPDGLRVKLAAVRVGKRWMTSRLALARFFGALTGSESAALAEVQPAIGLATQATLAAHGLAPGVVS